MINKDYNDEAYINDLVDRYKTTLDEGLRLSLIDAFDPYFKKYANIFCGTKTVDFSNKDTIKFLRCFMSLDERKNSATLNSAAKRVVGLLRSLYKDCAQQEIYDDVLCFFLEHLNRYKMMIATNTPHKSRISFTHFIQVSIRWSLIKFIKPREKDAMHRSCNLEFNDEIMVVEPPEMGVNWAQIDLKWVHGKTAGELFSRLTEMDRYLIYLKYEDEEENPLSDYDLAKITGLDRMWIRRRMLKVRDKLRELVANENLFILQEIS